MDRHRGRQLDRCAGPPQRPPGVRVVGVDGQRFLMLRGGAADDGELIWVQNWFEELKARVPTN